MSERAAPYYCPYCGDEDLFPYPAASEAGQGAGWHCRSCARAFRLSFAGIGSPSQDAPEHDLRKRVP
ncbi:Insertion element protein [Allonocardiopsis opalescens]|uniref:Insertion element protein n=1 Tax=Allonocardiopsis opalescens TaxID=1144618 RepID=A0A2T0PUF9_9ACTN|nr:Insertion element protein [Allonocardiopsis opalescens]PRX92366.1 hypothetical protein CLV72_110126 [Allonocardiopsis opalescens]